MCLKANESRNKDVHSVFQVKEGKFVIIQDGARESKARDVVTSVRLALSRSDKAIT